MPTIKMPDGSAVVTFGTQTEADNVQALLNARHAFVQQYCTEHGWPGDAEKLSIPQILEIREQDGWKEPAKS